MTPQATNNFVFIIRDETPDETNGFIIPDQGKKKPHSGKIVSIGKLARDPKIQSGKNKKALFHAGIGFEIEYEEVTYLVLMDTEIIAVL